MPCMRFALRAVVFSEYANTPRRLLPKLCDDNPVYTLPATTASATHIREYVCTLSAIEAAAQQPMCCERNDNTTTGTRTLIRAWHACDCVRGATFRHPVHYHIQLAPCMPPPHGLFTFYCWDCFNSLTVLRVHTDFFFLLLCHWTHSNRLLAPHGTWYIYPQNIRKNED